MELKLDKIARLVLQQIDIKAYSLPYKFDGKGIIKIGVNFSSGTRNISDWLIEKE